MSVEDGKKLMTYNDKPVYIDSVKVKGKNLKWENTPQWTYFGDLHI